MPRKNREYIQSHEENKNPIMALKKAVDLGVHHEIELDSNETVSMSSETAQKALQFLIELKSNDREDMLKIIWRDSDAMSNFLSILE
jgi:hypothetical protein